MRLKTGGISGIGNFFYRNRYVFLAFFVPFFLLFIAYAAMGFYPFGENQVAVIDMYHQYYPFISELHEKRKSAVLLERGTGNEFSRADVLLRGKPPLFSDDFCSGCLADGSGDTDHTD